MSTALTESDRNLIWLWSWMIIQWHLSIVVLNICSKWDKPFPYQNIWILIPNGKCTRNLSFSRLGKENGVERDCLQNLLPRRPSILGRIWYLWWVACKRVWSSVGTRTTLTLEGQMVKKKRPPAFLSVIESTRLLTTTAAPMTLIILHWLTYNSVFYTEVFS